MNDVDTNLVEKERYNYIWQVRENTFFEINKNKSPYLEINEEMINGKIKNSKIAVNPYIRFFEIFCPYEEIIQNENIKNDRCKYFKKKFENKVVNYLKKLDYIKGVTILDIYCEKIIEDLKDGLYGEKVSKNINKLNNKEQKIIAICLIQKIFYEYEEFRILKILINNFFKNNIIYRKTDDLKTIILYVNYKKNNENVAKIKIIKELFLPIELNLRVYYENHFGVVNIKEVIKLDIMGVF